MSPNQAQALLERLAAIEQATAEITAEVATSIEPEPVPKSNVVEITTSAGTVTAGNGEGAKAVAEARTKRDSLPMSTPQSMAIYKLTGGKAHGGAMYVDRQTDATYGEASDAIALLLDGKTTELGGIELVPVPAKVEAFIRRQKTREEKR